MERFKKFIKSNRHFFWLLSFCILYIWFFYLEKTVVPEYIMYSKIDDYIPFVKEFVIPYQIWYLYMIGAFVYLGFKSKEDYYKLFYFMFFGMAICYAVYTIFPNGQNLRPVITQTDILSRAIASIYTIDTPTNVAPSIHVLNSIAVHVALVKCKLLENNRLVKNISLVTMIIISASTVLIKQHSILDGIWSVVLSAFLYFCIYVLPQHLEDKLSLGKKLKEQGYTRNNN